MNRAFDKSGHISAGGFDALLSGSAGGMTRYELAEHLDRCDLCVDRYGVLLTGGVLIDPPEDLAEPVMASIRRRAFTVITGQTAKVCAAACLAIVIWCGGIFDGNIMAKGEAFSEKVAAGGVSVSQTLSGIGDAIGSWLSGFSINARGENYGTEK